MLAVHTMISECTKYGLFLKSGQFSMQKVEALLSHFELKTHFFMFFERDFSDLKLTKNKNQNTVNDIKQMVEWDTLQKIF